MEMVDQAEAALVLVMLQTGYLIQEAAVLQMLVELLTESVDLAVQEL
jgi:hypothetical protein